jgi:hypothetical protein
MHVKTAFCHHPDQNQPLQDSTLVILLSLISLRHAALRDPVKKQQ